MGLSSPDRVYWSVYWSPSIVFLAVVRTVSETAARWRGRQSPCPTRKAVATHPAMTLLLRLFLLCVLPTYSSAFYITTKHSGQANRIATHRAANAPMMLTGPELIDSGVRFDTFAPQFLWVLMVAAPRSEVTERVMGPITPIIGLSIGQLPNSDSALAHTPHTTHTSTHARTHRLKSLSLSPSQTRLLRNSLLAVHLAVVLLAASAPGGTEPIKIFADVFDPAKNQLDGMVRLFEVRDFVAEEWPHGEPRLAQAHTRFLSALATYCQS